MALTHRFIDMAGQLVQQLPPPQPAEAFWVPGARKVALAAVNRLIRLSVPFAGRAGFEVTALQTGYLEARIPIKGNRNHLGTMYAGALFTLAEIPGGVMALFDFGSDYLPVLKQLDMSYLAPGRDDVRVRFEMSAAEREALKAEADLSGKADFLLEGSLTLPDGSEVARSRGLYQLRKRNWKAVAAIDPSV